jgi:hypothetical protein
MMTSWRFSATAGSVTNVSAKDTASVSVNDSALAKVWDLADESRLFIGIMVFSFVRLALPGWH